MCNFCQLKNYAFVQDTTGAIYTCKTSDKRKKYLDEYKTFCAE